MYTGHPFTLVLVGVAMAAVAVAEEQPGLLVAGVAVSIIGAVWDWLRGHGDDAVGDPIVSSIAAGMIGVTMLVLAIAYAPWWSLAAAGFLAYVVVRLLVAVRRVDRAFRGR